MTIEYICIIIFLILIIVLLYKFLWSNTIYCMLFEKDYYNLCNKILKLPNSEFSLYINSFDRPLISIKSKPELNIWLCDYKKEAFISDKFNEEFIFVDWLKKGNKKIYKRMCNLFPEI